MTEGERIHHAETGYPHAQQFEDGTLGLIAHEMTISRAIGTNDDGEVRHVLLCLKRASSTLYVPLTAELMDQLFMELLVARQWLEGVEAN
jgi:hypothetical protein